MLGSRTTGGKAPMSVRVGAAVDVTGGRLALSQSFSQSLPKGWEMTLEAGGGSAPASDGAGTGNVAEPAVPVGVLGLGLRAGRSPGRMEPPYAIGPLNGVTITLPSGVRVTTSGFGLPSRCGSPTMAEPPRRISPPFAIKVGVHRWSCFCAKSVRVDGAAVPGLHEVALAVPIAGPPPVPKIPARRLLKSGNWGIEAPPEAPDIDDIDGMLMFGILVSIVGAAP